ncbi:hypothetical protein CROQUDRAFT_720011 [Cronartium quercuum f. sp. fusiforme G11]|uniref:Uncharacterized protein n=1 Tax=Cronartium quercuum f. sp. fusiforme G11 TaxID=708437 RepID=A0A9P6NSQ6_9BASI|nr:hypothetical protein CROQUDRAFT_720011 [Cronartium quercuum f. sp. fusiforme G11]
MFSFIAMNFFPQIMSFISVVNFLATFLGSGPILTLDVYFPPWLWCIIIISLIISFHSKEKTIIKVLEERIPGFITISLGPISFSVTQLFAIARWASKKLKFSSAGDALVETHPESAMSEPLLFGVQNTSYGTMQPSIVISVVDKSQETLTPPDFEVEILCEK